MKKAETKTHGIKNFFYSLCVKNRKKIKKSENLRNQLFIYAKADGTDEIRTKLSHRF